MCRIIGYVGKEISIDKIVSLPHGLRDMAQKSPELQGDLKFCTDGWSIGWFDRDKKPGKIGGTKPIYMDENAPNALPVIRSTSVQGVVRLASPETIISVPSNPQYYADGALLCFNGECKPWPGMRMDWLLDMDIDLANNIKDSTEPEHFVALWRTFGRRVGSRGQIEALISAYAKVEEHIKRHRGHSALNMVLNRPDELVAVRWSYNQDHHSLYYCLRPDAVWVASEPVNPDKYEWQEFPKQTFGTFRVEHEPEFIKL